MAKKATAGKKAEGTLGTTAHRVGRTPGRAARGIDTNTTAVKKGMAPAKSATRKAKTDPVAQGKRKQDRAAWKRQADEAASRELSKPGTLVDERARVRATASTGWANRKPR